MFNKKEIKDLRNEIRECANCGCLVWKDNAIRKIDNGDIFGCDYIYYCKKCAPKEIEVKGVKYKKK